MCRTGNGRERPGTGILRPLGITPDTQGLTPGAGTAGNGPERLALLAHEPAVAAEMAGPKCDLTFWRLEISPTSRDQISDLPSQPLLAGW